jgi:hypothetical protein
VVPQLRSQLTAQHLPAPAVDAAVRQFQTCFHDRASENDPTVLPPSCRRAQSAAPNRTVAAIFQNTAGAALGIDFLGSLKRSLLYPIGVFITACLLVFLIPPPQRREGWPGAAGGAH